MLLRKTKNSFTCGILFLLFIGFTSYAQNDTLLIKKFASSDYNAGLTNYTGVADEKGIIYFGNTQGVLVYDGSAWSLVSIGKGLSITALLLAKDTLYIGSNDEIGYILTEGENKYQYHSLNHLVKDLEDIDDVWQIKRTSAGIYFQSYNGLLFYDGSIVTSIDVKDSYIFNIDDNLLASSFNGELFLINGKNVVNTLEISDIAGDAGFSLLPIDDATYLLFTSEHGAFVIDLPTFSISPWQSQINRKLKEDGVYHAIEYHDFYLCSTWDKGLILVSKEGELIRQIGGDKGLPNRNLREIFIDSNDNIWIPSGDGIYQIRLNSNRTAGHFRPQSIIKGIRSELGAITQVENIFDPTYIILDYTTPGYDQDVLEYSFYLDGYDEEWTPWTKMYRKEYTNLKHGQYEFQLRSRVAGTVELLSEASLIFGIILPWHKRPAIYLSSLLIILFIVGTIILVRNRELKLSRDKLEVIVEQRTQELVDEQGKLKETNRELAISNTELDNFVYRSSHDLIAPLKSLRGLMNITKLETKDNQLLNYISMMESSVLKLEDFISSIMDYSINTNAGSDIDDIDLPKLVKEIIDDIKYFDKFKHLELIFNIDTPLIKTDPRRLKIVLSNLITNAVKYHNINRKNPYIKISAYLEGANYVIKIEDNGQGIAEEHLHKIFDMFYRASVESEGSGLGLYIVKETTNKLGGEITIESKVGEGSTFSLILPYPELTP